MAVAFDGEAILSGRHASSSTWTISGKTTAGSDRVGIVRFMGNATFTSITWGGVAMTEIGTVTRGSLVIRSYAIVDPPTSASDIVINFVAPGAGPYAVTSYNGVDQADPIGDVQTATGTGTTPTVDVSSAADDMVLDAMDVANVISSVGANQTAEYLDTTGSSDRFGASREAGAATVTMSWTVSSGAWSTMGFSLNAAGDAGSIVPIINHYMRQGRRSCI